MKKKRFALTVIGCGKMGLPIALQAALRGVDVTGVDKKAALVDAINKGRMPFEEPLTRGLLSRLVRRGRFKATTDIRMAVSRADAVIVIVPVLLTASRQADLRALLSVTGQIACSIKRGAVLSYETTLPVGTTRRVILPILESSGRKAEKDFYLVFSPERVKSGTVLHQMRSVPKIVGGIGPLSLKKGIGLYRRILACRIINVGTLENAEMVKLAGMIYRDVNIALSNELARYGDALGIDLTRLIPAVNTDNEAHLLYPGIGVGGHCTPVYPYFLIHDAKKRNCPQGLAAMARSLNDSQARYVVDKLEKTLGTLRGRSVLLLGLGFRPGVKEDTCSPAYLVRDVLKERKARCYLADPLYTQAEISDRGFKYDTVTGRRKIDAVILITAHKAFFPIPWSKLKTRGVCVFVDGRGSCAREDAEARGIAYLGVGQGGSRFL